METFICSAQWDGIVLKRHSHFYKTAFQQDIQFRKNSCYDRAVHEKQSCESTGA